IRFRWVVFAAWVILFLAAGTASSGLSNLLTNRFVLPGSDSEKAADILKNQFGQKPEGSFTLVVRTQTGKAPSMLPQVRAAGARARSRPGPEPRPARRRALHRDPDRDADPDLRLRVPRLPASVHARGHGDSGHARRDLDLRPLHDPLHLPPEHGHVDRARHRD